MHTLNRFAVSASAHDVPEAMGSMLSVLAHCGTVKRRSAGCASRSLCDVVAAARNAASACTAAWTALDPGAAAKSCAQASASAHRR